MDLHAGYYGSGFKIRQIFFGAERSDGAVLAKISGAEFEKYAERSARLHSAPLKSRSIAPRILNPAMAVHLNFAD